MASVAVDILVHAGLPAVMRFYHDVAVHAKIGVILGIIVKVQ